MLIDEVYNLDIPRYEQTTNIAQTKGADSSLLNNGVITNSLINKLHLIKLVGIPFNDDDLRKNEKYQRLTYTDLCNIDSYARSYDPDDFLYCKNFGLPINHLITLRRFPFPCTDNLYDKDNQQQPDVSRMVTYFHQDVNKLDDLLAFSYATRWKELQSEMEQATMQGDQSGFDGFLKKIYQVIDPNLWENKLRGDNANMVDPKYDQNKVYGPVDSITNTHIRDVGLDFNKEFDLVFEYELKSIGGRTPEYAMKDIIGNILATTFQNARFWPGSRYWVGDRPASKESMDKLAHMNSDQIDEQTFKNVEALKNAVRIFGEKKSAIKMVKDIVQGSFALGVAKIADKIGRPSILTMNSLLSGEPTGFWHVTIGNPENPILCIGNLICTGVDFKFPTDSLSYGDFPTQLQVNIKLKPGKAKDRAGIEMMFNTGRQRIYYAPKSITKPANKTLKSGNRLSFLNLDNGKLLPMLGEAYDFLTKNVEAVTETIKENTGVDLPKAGEKLLTPSKENTDTIYNFAYKYDGYVSTQTAWRDWNPPKDPDPQPVSPQPAPVEPIPT
jgi:hypothetical protein